MSCNFSKENDKHFHSNCVCNVVRFINELQECASTTYSLSSNVPFLGPRYRIKIADTRPFILYTRSGSMFEAYIPSENITNSVSSIFRVESIDDDCYAVLRPLTVFVDGEPVSDTNPSYIYLSMPHAKLHATPSCVTVDLNYFCGIQCLRDALITNC